MDSWNRDNLSIMDKQRGTIDPVQELKISISEINPPMSKQWTKAGAASNKSIEMDLSEGTKATPPDFFVKPCPQPFCEIK